MRPHITITIGTIGLSLSLALSAAVGLSWPEALTFCALLTGALAFGAWVLSADPRTDRLERLLRVLLERRGKPTKPGPED